MKEIKMSQQDSNTEANNKRIKWSSLFLPYFVSIILLLLGFLWLNDINTKGYYADHKNQMIIVGEQGLVTVYGLIVGGFCMLALSIYATFKKIRNNKIG